MLIDIRDDFFQVFQRSPQWYAYAPGRVNLLGEHVDYNEGPVLPAALDMRVELAAALASEDIISIYAIDFNEKTVFSLRDINSKQDPRRQTVSGLGALSCWGFIGYAESWI